MTGSAFFMATAKIIKVSGAELLTAKTIRSRRG